MAVGLLVPGPARVEAVDILRSLPNGRLEDRAALLAWLAAER